MAHAYDVSAGFLNPRSWTRRLAGILGLQTDPRATDGDLPAAASIKAVRPLGAFAPRSWRGAIARTDDIQKFGSNRPHLLAALPSDEADREDGPAEGGDAPAASGCCGCSGENCRRQQQEAAAS